MNYKPNCGAGPMHIKDGYVVLGEGPKRPRDGQMNPAQVPQETDNGGFLGRVEQTESESKSA